MSRAYHTRLKPSEIRFTQDSIAGRFQSGSFLNNAIQDILIGILSPDDFPPIRVIVLNGKLYSFDNRRLYVFRVCEFNGVVSEVRVKVVSISNLQEGRLTTENDGVTVRVRQGGTKNHYKKPWLLNEDDRGNKNIPPTSKHTHATSRPATNVLNYPTGTGGTKHSVLDNPYYPSNSRCEQVDGIQRDTVRQSVREKHTYSMPAPTSSYKPPKAPLPSSSSTSTHPIASGFDSSIKRKSSRSHSTRQPYFDKIGSAHTSGRRTASQPPLPRVVSVMQPPPRSILASGTRSQVRVDRRTSRNSSETTDDSEPMERSRGFFSRLRCFLCCRGEID